MVKLYSKKVYELSKADWEDDLDGSLSYLNTKEKDLIVRQRICSYSLSECAKRNEKNIILKLRLRKA